MRVRTVQLGGAAAVGIGLFFSASIAHAAPWPSGSEGDISGGNTVEFSLPEAPPGTTYLSLGSGSYSSLALGADGEIYGWGGNAGGELGTGAAGSQSRPQRVLAPAGVGFTSVAVGLTTSYGIGTDHNAYSWGSNGDGFGGDGVLGRDPSVSPKLPGKIETPSGVQFTEIVAADRQAFALDAEGNAYSWGYGVFGQLGNGTWTLRQQTPVPVTLPGGVKFTQISGLGSHALAIGDDRNTYAWGDNWSGLLGTPNGPTSSNVPARVTTPPGVRYTQVAAGWDFSVALGDDGALYSWGMNYLGSLGTGGSSDSSVPRRVLTPQGETFVSVVNGGKHVLALTDSGEIYAWGANSYGELGNGTTSSSGASIPVLVTAPDGVSFEKITAGAGTSFAIGSDGTTYSWGQNSYGQLGDGTRVNTALPTPVISPDVQVVVSEVLIGDTPAEHVQQTPEGTVKVTIPAGEAYGAHDVTVRWTADGVPQADLVVPDGYTYVGAPTATDPGPAEVGIGETAVFTTEVSGYPEPEVSWESAEPGTDIWVAATGDPAVEVSADGLSLRVVADSAHQGMTYRAVATNRIDTATTAPATLTIPEHRVTYDSRGGSAVETQTVLRGAALGNGPKPPLRDGYRFKSWTLCGSAGAYDFSAPVTTDLVLCATWTAVSGPTPDPGPGPRPGAGLEGESAAASTPHPLVATGQGNTAASIAAGVGLLTAGVAVFLTRRRRDHDAKELWS